MGQIFKIDKSSRDEELGLIKKQITCDDNSFFLDTPIVSQRANKIDPEIKVQEIIKHIDDKVVESLDSRYIKTYTDSVKAEWATDKLNATLFNFRYKEIPEDESLKTIAHALHGASDKVIFLPTVMKALLMEKTPDRKSPIITMDRIDSYKRMMKLIMDEITKPQNGKQIVGMIPFVPWKFAKPIVDFYCSEGIRAFAIDCGFRDIVEYKDDFARVLSRIKDTIPLDKTVIFAFNAGVPSSFQVTEVESDDFLGVFAYVDVLGSTFKSRGGGSKEPKARVFSRSRYSYEISTYSALQSTFGKSVNYYTIRNYNKSEQRRETAKIRDLVGVEKMKNYLATKQGVNQESVKRLESIAQEVG